MIKKTLALSEQVLRRQVRARGPYIMRATMVGFCLFGIFTARESSSFVGAPGLQFFGVLATANLWFISSHILSELATLCDGVTIIDRGTVQFSGEMSELLSHTNEQGKSCYEMVLGDPAPELAASWANPAAG